MDDGSQNSSVPQSRSAPMRRYSVGHYITDEEIVKLEKRLPKGARIGEELRWKLEHAVAMHRLWPDDCKLTLKPSASLRQVAAAIRCMEDIERRLKNIQSNERLQLENEDVIVRYIYLGWGVREILNNRARIIEGKLGENGLKGNHRREFILGVQRALSEYGIEIVYACNNTGKRRTRASFLGLLFEIAEVTKKKEEEDKIGLAGVDRLLDELWPPAAKGRS